MAYKITEECISCSACEGECKNAAISEGDTTYVIDAAKCTEWAGWFESPRCVEVCPVDDVCVPDPAHQETKEQLVAKWRNMNPGQEPVSGSY